MKLLFYLFPGILMYNYFSYSLFLSFIVQKRVSPASTLTEPPVRFRQAHLQSCHCSFQRWAYETFVARLGNPFANESEVEAFSEAAIGAQTDIHSKPNVKNCDIAFNIKSSDYAVIVGSPFWKPTSPPTSMSTVERNFKHGERKYPPWPPFILVCGLMIVMVGYLIMGNFYNVIFEKMWCLKMKCLKMRLKMYHHAYKRYWIIV